MNDCVFCRIVRDEEPAHKLWADHRFLAFLSIHPVNAGHTLLIPKQHAEYIFDFKEPLYTEIFQAARRLAKSIKVATKAKRVALAVEGLSVRHLHIHLVPVNNAGELDPHRQTRMSAEELFQVAERIRGSIKASQKSPRR